MGCVAYSRARGIRENAVYILRYGTKVSEIKQLVCYLFLFEVVIMEM
jgi:hypothetical protein